MADTVAITLNVRDNATPAVVSGVQQQNRVLTELQQRGQAVSTTFKGVETSVREFTQSARALTAGLVGELNPALGQAVVQMAGMARGAASFTGILGPVGAGLAAAAAAFIPYIANVREATERQAGLNLAARSFDPGPLRAALQASAKDLETQAERTKSFVGVLLNAVRGLSDALGYTTAATEDQARARERLAQVLPFERLQAEVALRIQELQALQQLRGVEEQRAALRGDLADYLRIHDQIAQALSNQTSQIERQLKLEAEKKIAAARALNEPPEAIAGIRADLDRQITTLATQANAKFQTLDEQKTRVLKAVEDERLQIALQTVQVYSQQAGLSAEEKAQLDLQVIAAREKLELARAQVSFNRAAAVEAATLEARLRSSAVVRQRFEATDPLAGLTAGFRQAANEWAQTGAVMADLARATSRDMASAFSDGFFSVLTGNFKELPNVARHFSHAMVREVTDALAKITVAPLLENLQSGLSRFLTRAPVVVGGASAGTQFLVGPGGRLVSSAEAAQAYQVGGQPAVNALTTGRIASASEADALMGGTVAPLATTGSAVSFGQVVGPAASTALLGLTAVGAYQGTRTTQDVLLNAGMGALLGAQAGFQIAGALGSSGGTGGAIGAVVGAAILAGISLYGKQQAEKEAKKQRELAEAQRAAGGGQELVNAAGRARNLQELFDIITSFGSGSVGGTSSIAVPVTVQTPTGPRMIGQPNATYPVASVEDLLRSPESLAANIQAGVDPNLLAGPNQATSQALQQMATDLANQFRAVQEGVGVTVTEQLAGGLTRRTTVPETLAERLAGGTGPIGIESPGFSDLDDADKELLLRDLHRIAADRDMRVFVRDPETDQVVTSAMVAPATAGTTPPPPGVPPAAIPAVEAAANLNLPRFTEPLPPPTPIYGDVNVTPSDETPNFQQQIIGYTPPTQPAIDAYNARKLAFYASSVDQLTAEQRATLAALTTQQVGALVGQGYLSLEQVATFIEAGLLPNVRQALIDDAIDAIAGGAGDGAGGSVPGSPGSTGTGPISGGFLSAARIGASLGALGIGLSELGLNPSLVNIAGFNVQPSDLLSLIAAQFLGPIFGLANTFLGGAVAIGQQAATNAAMNQSLYAGLISGQLSPVAGVNPATGQVVALTPAQSAAFNPTTLGMDPESLAQAFQNGLLSLEAFQAATYVNTAFFGVSGSASLPGVTGTIGLGQIGYTSSGQMVDLDPTSNTFGKPVGAATGNAVPGSTNFGEGEGNTSGGVPGSSDGGAGAAPGGQSP